MIYNNSNEEKPIYLDHTKTFEERVNDLVSRSRLEEKISQMINISFTLTSKNIFHVNNERECIIAPETKQLSIEGCQPSFSDDEIGLVEGNFEVQGKRLSLDY